MSQCLKTIVYISHIPMNPKIARVRLDKRIELLEQASLNFIKLSYNILLRYMKSFCN